MTGPVTLPPWVSGLLGHMIVYFFAKTGVQVFGDQ